MTAEQIYTDAVKRAWRDHEQMVDQFMRGEIEIASPCFDDRQKKYVIEAFDRALALTPAQDHGGSVEQATRDNLAGATPLLRSGEIPDSSAMITEIFGDDPHTAPAPAESGGGTP